MISPKESNKNKSRLQEIFEEALNNALSAAEKNSSSEDIPEEEAEQLIADIVSDCAGPIADDIIAVLKENAKETLRLQRDDELGFVRRNNDRWKDGFDALEVLLSVCKEMASELNVAHAYDESVEPDAQYDVAIRLHARACHIASEVLWLMKGGFADGAQARWRALHEVVVTALFLLKHDNELSIRYLEHEGVARYRGINQFNEYASRISAEPFSDDVVSDCASEFTHLLEKYGKGFGGRNGWVGDVLKNPKPSFFSLEKEVELDHMRPYYNWASQNVHANIHGLKDQLGLVEAKEEILMVGPSNSGMTNPADLTSLSLAVITTRILEMFPSVDSLVNQHVVSKLYQEVAPIFMKIDSKRS